MVGAETCRFRRRALEAAELDDPEESLDLRQCRTGHVLFLKRSFSFFNLLGALARLSSGGRIQGSPERQRPSEDESLCVGMLSDASRIARS